MRNNLKVEKIPNRKCTTTDPIIGRLLYKINELIELCNNQVDEIKELQSKLSHVENIASEASIYTTRYGG